MTFLHSWDEDLDLSYNEWEYENEREAYAILSQMLEDEEA